MKKYRQRLLDKVLEEYLEGLPAICIDGAKGVGKTSTASRHSAAEFKFDKAVTREYISASPAFLDSTDKPVLLDEWQRLPFVWDEVKRLVDEDSSPGRFMLTGSAYPKDATIHSGAGRIVHLRMRPLSIQEREIGTPTVHLSDLLFAKVPEVSGTTDVTLSDYLEEIARSGLPAINQLSTKNARRQLSGYVDNIIEKEFEQLGYTVRRPQALRNWFASYAAAQATTTNYTTILDRATPGEPDKPSEKTTRSYREILEKLWLIDEVAPWLPIGSNYKDLGKTPKHYLVDPALAMVLLDLTIESFGQKDDSDDIGTKGKTELGRFFEALIAQSLQTYALVNDATLRHFRSSNGAHEVDFIVQKGKSVLAIEVKLASSSMAYNFKHLNWFAEKFSDFNVTKCVITAGPYAFTRNDGIHIIPAALLGA